MVALRARPPGGPDRWARVNYRGEPVTLLEGPALVLAAVWSLALPVAPPRVRAGALLAVLGSGALGAYDDLAGEGESKGLRGHLAALRRGRVSTGLVKLVGLAATGVAASALARQAVSGPGGAVDLMGCGAVVAGSANLVNLLDLRPGRALKAVLLCAPLARGAGGPVWGVAAGAAVGLLRGDLGERSMLGDTGANSAGALLGVALVAGSPPRTRWAALAVLTGLTLASELVSFTRVIESTPGLRELDRLGRRPAQRPATT